MWTPVNFEAIPSVQDRIHALKAISVIENELRDALLALERAQHRVDDLEKDLQERRAWIAPIKRLPYEILSYIFELCGEDEWTSMLEIVAVSRFWREVGLSTPRAWSFIPFESICHSSAASQLLLQRSGQRLLHAFITGLAPDPFIADITHRLVCMITEAFFPDPRVIFPNLQRLVLGEVGEPIEASGITNIQFPALKHLVCIPHIYSATRHFPEGAVAKLTAGNFWPLESLHISMVEDPTWLLILQSCAETLVSLNLSSCRETYEHTPAPSLTIRLPKLKSLVITCSLDGDMQDGDMDHDFIWPMNLLAPVLEIYSYLGCRGGHDPVALPHRDIGSISHMHTNENLSLSLVPRLRVLEIRSLIATDNFLAQLALDGSLCPRLELIETISSADFQEGSAVITEMNKGRKQPIIFSQGPHWKVDLPGRIPRSCGSDMPCHVAYIYVDDMTEDTTEGSTTEGSTGSSTETTEL